VRDKDLLTRSFRWSWWS